MSLSQGINVRLDLGKKTEEEQMALTKKHRDKIKFWFIECREVYSNFFYAKLVVYFSVST